MFAACRLSFLSLVVMFFATACGEESIKTPKTDYGKRNKSQHAITEEDADRDQPEEPKQQRDFDFELDPNAAFLDANFGLKINAVDSDVCEGQIAVKVNASVGTGPNAVELLKIPNARVECLGSSFDLSQIMGAMMQGMINTKDGDLLSVKDGIIALSSIGPSRYTPPRPMFPSFLAADRATLQAIDKVFQLSVYDQKAQKSDVGSLHFKVTAVGTPYQVAATGKTFKDTIAFESTIEGFETLDKVDNVIFQRMAIVMSLNPVALLHIEIDSTAADFADGADKAGVDLPQDGLIGGAIDAIAGLIDVHVELDLLDMEGLDKAASINTDGPVVGGQQL